MIAGRAVCNGSAAAGARVVIAGTSFDATTGQDGRFALLHVPPGTYALSLRMQDQPAAQMAGVVVSGQATSDVGDVAVCGET